MLLKRPRNVNSTRAAGILYGDWGTSKAYVTGIAFALAAYSSFYLILAMSVLTAVVGINYIWVCKHYPDGGGVYSSVRHRSRTLAVIGALLLTADYTITASLSTLDAFHYLGLHHPEWWAIGTILLLGAVNAYGPRHSGSMAVFLAAPAVLVVIGLAAAASPHLDAVHLAPAPARFRDTWFAFVEIILALSGVEAIANMTGVMETDRGSSADHPTVHLTARRAILPVLFEVTIFTTFLGLAMHAVPNLSGHTEDMLKYLGEYYVGPWFGQVVGVVFAILLLSAANTAIIGLVSILYLMSHDGEMPRPFRRLNRYGVPLIPLIVATAMPVLVLLIEKDLTRLAALYAIGVVGAIAINLGACSTNFKLGLSRLERTVMMGTFVVIGLIELTIAYRKSHALLFAATILGVGLVTRTAARTLHERHERRLALAPPAPIPTLAPAPVRAAPIPVTSLLVAIRGPTETLRFAVEQARLYGAMLFVL
ncbi:amino acid permease, partial [bacterium]|nr:amino acid permease [bacterium]